MSRQKPPSDAAPFRVSLSTIFCVVGLWLSQAHSQDKTEDSENHLIGAVLRVSFEENKQLRNVTGELVALDATLGQLILDADGQLTAIAPNELKRIETDAGRVRDVRWGPRTLDLDIVLFERQSVREPGLTVPHPELSNRDFWLRELAALRSSRIG